MSAGQLQQPDYTERLWVPVGWWVLSALFALSLLIAVLFYLGPVWGIVSGLLVMVVMGLLFVRYGREQIRVDADRLWVGAANIEWTYVAGARALDDQATRRRRGPESDARAYLVLRPYLNRAVEVTISDQADPTPYWLISSRAPDRLAAAITARCGAQSSPPDRAPEQPPGPARKVATENGARPEMSPPSDTLDS